MSDHRPAPDPLDTAYAEAEAMLDDDAARAARRARLLGAVQGEVPTGTPRAETYPRRQRLSWRHGGWLAAASVVGLSVLVAVREPSPPVASQQAAESASPAATPPVPAMEEAPASVETASAAATTDAAAADAVSQAGASPPSEVAEVEATAPVPPPPPLQTAPPPVAAPPPASARAAPRDTAEAIVTNGEVASTAASARSAAAQAEPASPPIPAARLRAAAAGGRLSELTALLRQGVLVDAADEAGDTALIQAVRANRPAAAALLRRYGANLDLENRRGESARDIAASIGDPELTRALGLAP
jgi:hypothetical protein